MAPKVRYVKAPQMNGAKSYAAIQSCYGQDFSTAEREASNPKKPTANSPDAKLTGLGRVETQEYTVLLGRLEKKECNIWRTQADILQTLIQTCEAKEKVQSYAIYLQKLVSLLLCEVEEIASSNYMENSNRYLQSNWAARYRGLQSWLKPQKTRQCPCCRYTSNFVWVTSYEGDVHDDRHESCVVCGRDVNDI